MKEYIEVHCINQEQGCRTCKHCKSFEKSRTTIEAYDGRDYDAWEVLCDHYKQPHYITVLSGCYGMYEPKDGV